MLTTSLVDTFSIPTLLKTYQIGKSLKLLNSLLIVLNWKIVLKAYETFANSIEQHSLKIILRP